MHKFEPQKTARLLSAERESESELSPEWLLREAGLKEGETFADIGCGPGFFTIPAAAIVGDRGTVLAIDTQVEMLDQLKERRPPKNVLLLKSEENLIPAEDGKADFVLLAFVLHEAEKKDVFLKEIKRITRRGGIIFILDWKKKKEEKGPPLNERLSVRSVRELLKEAGYVKVRAGSLNPSHYRILARKE